jgi:hypothetical protein
MVGDDPRLSRVDECLQSATSFPESATSFEDVQTKCGGSNNSSRSAGILEELVTIQEFQKESSGERTCALCNK